MLFLIVISIFIIIVIIYFYITRSVKLPPAGDWLTKYKYAHRGLHNAYYPENTIGAFKNAVENGYAIELDVQISKDKIAMVFHDNELKRLTGKQGRIRDYTAQELETFKINDSDYSIVRLSDVLKEINGAVPILIETKNEGFANDLEPIVLSDLKDYKGKFAIQSFSPFSIQWFKKNKPDILRGQLSSDFKNTKKTKPIILYFGLKNLLTNFISKPHFISYDKNGIECLLIKRLKKYGTGILCWTIENPSEQKEVSNYSDSIIFENYKPY